MAFRRCESLKSIELPNSVETIGHQSFQGCVSMETIILPESTTLIETKAFSNCINLKELYCYAEDTPEVTSDAFENVEVGKVTLGVPDNSIGAYKNHPVWGKFLIDSVTGISVTTALSPQKKTLYFNMAGQCMSRAAKGIYIKDGRKVVF